MDASSPNKPHYAYLWAKEAVNMSKQQGHAVQNTRTKTTDRKANSSGNNK